MIPSLESQDTSLRVDLNRPLQPGDSLVMEMDFELSIPTEMGGNYGLYGYFEDVLVLDTFYPMIPAYDEKGWYSQTPQDNGDLTYTDASYYIVQVQAPADMVLASTGVAVDKQVEGSTQSTVLPAVPPGTSTWQAAGSLSRSMTRSAKPWCASTPALNTASTRPMPWILP